MTIGGQLCGSFFKCKTARGAAPKHHAAGARYAAPPRSRSATGTGPPTGTMAPRPSTLPGADVCRDRSIAGAPQPGSNRARRTVWGDRTVWCDRTVRPHHLETVLAGRGSDIGQVLQPFMPRHVPEFARPILGRLIHHADSACIQLSAIHATWLSGSASGGMSICSRSFGHSMRRSCPFMSSTSEVQLSTQSPSLQYKMPLISRISAW